ncbi:hypothetical protein ANOM_010856 [Aspergillus nomiae NRRL 13137]|uniref:Polyketide synthase n=1 Tax=Aspergillus nomiae NRRL (strain ATCC 15546 / NRRL 13137 / CBS 260.88 / M93) TaxID=1509407 RepID=A0A0L1INP8_ASPN3|nr:uncharacterized protein ANOM_010856 [Aspergillus nomiae NRRL 13137]KNG81162.1 hypothetical protein ANOM_010856 [Aspergillus nomiae NRRL 13137]
MSDSTPLAIIGVANRFPQEASDTEGFWKLLLRGRQSATPFPKDRINADGYYHPDVNHPGTFHTKEAHFLSEDPAYFDAPFFNITRAELLSMDPRQRLLLENVYHALENAGIRLNQAASSKTAVFVAGSSHDHLISSNIDPGTTSISQATGTGDSCVANRVSWSFNLKGPSVYVDIACSGGLVAVHLAAQSLKLGECEMAIASGVTYLGGPQEFTTLNRDGFLGSKGRCFSFDHRAEGYARAEGVGTIIIKTLSAAIRDCDSIRAIIRGTATNQDGHTPGISLPSEVAQEMLIREAYHIAGLDPNDTRFVEAHGTGTVVGDVTESSAIAGAFNSVKRSLPLYIGSLKSGIGHLESVAGIAGIIKSILVLESGVIPPNVNFEKINPKIQENGLNLAFPAKCVPWPTAGARQISVNSFGFGGTNAHCILSDAHHFLKAKGVYAAHNTRTSIPTENEIDHLVAKLEQCSQTQFSKASASHKVSHNGVTKESRPGLHRDCPDRDNCLSLGKNLFIFSAFDRDALKRLMSEYLSHLKSRSQSTTMEIATFLRDLAYTLSERRSKFRWNNFIVAGSLSELIYRLSDVTRPPDSPSPLKAPKIVFAFNGQGVQYARMGVQLLVYPVFKESLSDATNYMKKLGSPWILLEELVHGDNTLIDNSAISQPACVAIQIALVDLLASWNIFPRIVVGHSSGEISAAYCAGYITREAAWQIAYYRGYVSSRTTRSGSMLVAGLEEEHLTPYIRQVQKQSSGELVISCYNSPKNNTLSGDQKLIDEMKQLLDSVGVFARKLPVKHAYHSGLMQEVANEYLRLVGNPPINTSRGVSSDIQMFSSVTGAIISPAHLDESYWVRNLISPVRFTDALNSVRHEMIDKGNFLNKIVIEVGPHPALKHAIRDILGAEVRHKSLLMRHGIETETILTTIGELSCEGVPVDILRANEPDTPTLRKREMIVNTPTYPFTHRERMVHEDRLSRNVRLSRFSRHSLLGAPVIDWNPYCPRWRHFISIYENPWLKDHMIEARYVFPGSAYVTMAIEASKQIAYPGSKVSGFRLRDVSFNSMLIIPDTKEGIEINLCLSPGRTTNTGGFDVWQQFQVTSYDSELETWRENCIGQIMVEYEAPNEPVGNEREDREATQTWDLLLEQAAKTCQTPMDVLRMYETLKSAGLTFGPQFRLLQDVTVSGNNLGEAFGTVRVPDFAALMPQGYMQPYTIPATIDPGICLGFAGALDLRGKLALNSLMVGTSLKEAWVSAKNNSNNTPPLRSHARVYHKHNGNYKMNIHIWDNATDKGLMSVTGAVSALRSWDSAANKNRQSSYTLDWKPNMAFLKSNLSNGSPITNELSPADRLSMVDSASATSGCPTSAGCLKMALIYANEKAQPIYLGVELKQALIQDTEANDILECGLYDLDDIDLSGRLCIFLLEVKHPVLCHLSKSNFLKLRNALSSCQRLLWITGDPITEPRFSISTGLIRTIRWERDMDKIDLATLAIRDDGTAATRIIQAISSIASNQLLHSLHTPQNEEYCFQDGIVYVLRLAKCFDADKFLHSKFTKAGPEMVTWKDIRRSVVLHNPTPGPLHKMHWEADRSPPTIELCEVEIQIAAVGLSFRDVYTAMGISDHGFGQEGAGVVTRVGAEVEDLQPGDRVLFMADPGKTAFGNYVRVDRRFIAVMPSGMSMGVAAALPTAFSTVIYSLKHAGVLRAGERILIHAAAGGVGQAAIQYAKLLGAEVFATVSSKAKKELLMKVYGIAEDHIFSSRDLSFATGVMRLTKNQGVDMILNSRPGEPLRRSWECIAPFGRFVEIGNIDLIADKLDMSPLLRSASITGVELTVIMEYKPDVIKNILEEVVSSWNQGKIRSAQPLTVLSFAQLEHGFKQLRSGQNMGKIVFQPCDSDIIPVAPIIAPPYTLDANATYVLAGGLVVLAGAWLSGWLCEEQSTLFSYPAQAELTGKSKR